MKGYLLIGVGLAALGVSALPTDLTPSDGACVPTHTLRQSAWIALPRVEREQRFADRAGRAELAAAEPGQGKSWWPKPVTLAWEGTDGAPCRVEVRKDTDAGALVFATNAPVTSVCVRNLEIGARYVWCVSDGAGSASSAFVTSPEAPRLLADAHVPNIRDLGGRVGLGGRRVRQGLIYRSAGLNDNASDVYTTNRASIAALDAYGVCAALARQYEQRTSDWRQLAARPRDLKLVAVRFPSEWRVLRAPEMPPFEAKARLLGLLPTAYAETVRAEADGCVDLHGIGSGSAVLEAVLDAEDDGFAVLGCGADWYWALSVNDAMVRDRMNRGNGKQPVSSGNHTVCVRVRKGANVVRVYLGAGSGGFYWHCAPGKATSRDKLAASEATASEDLSRELYNVRTGCKAGKTRIHDDNRAFWLDELGIRTEIDLRSYRETHGMTGSPLGATVAWEHVPYTAYAGIGDASGRQMFARLFRIFLDPARYPIDFHCIAGQDRTGTLAFLLNGLLGVGDEEKALDWEMSGLCNDKLNLVHATRYNRLEAALQDQPGATLNDRIYAYALGCGITADEIARFRDFMLTDR